MRSARDGISPEAVFRGATRVSTFRGRGTRSPRRRQRRAPGGLGARPIQQELHSGGTPIPRSPADRRAGANGVAEAGPPPRRSGPRGSASEARGSRRSIRARSTPARRGTCTGDLAALRDRDFAEDLREDGAGDPAGDFDGRLAGQGCGAPTDRRWAGVCGTGEFSSATDSKPSPTWPWPPSLRRSSRMDSCAFRKGAGLERARAARRIL